MDKTMESVFRWCLLYFCLTFTLSNELTVEIPYGGLIVGDVITIRGTPNSAGSFAINFKVMNGDTALHLRPNFHNWLVYRNAYVSKVWGERETFGSFPFTLHQNFTMTILVESFTYMIAVDNEHFTAFTHRVPPSKVMEITTWGDIDYLDINVKKQPRPDYPYPIQAPLTPVPYIHQPAMPFMGTIPGCFDANRKIRLWGKVLEEMKGIEINLQETDEFIHDTRHHVTVGLRINVMLEEKPTEVVLSAHREGDTYTDRFDCAGFAVGADFLLDIEVLHSVYKVMVNNAYCGELDHIIPVQVIDHILIIGSVRLHSVQYF